MLAGVVAMVCFGPGQDWIVVTAKLSKNVKVLRDACKEMMREMTAEDCPVMLEVLGKIFARRKSPHTTRLFLHERLFHHSLNPVHRSIS
jgi:hypothetical protein